MKKALGLFALLVGFNSFSQETDVKPEKVKVDFYIGFSGQTYSKIGLNDKLVASALPQIKETLPEFHIGLNFFGEKFSGDGEFGFFTSKNDNFFAKNKITGTNVKIRGHYNFVNKEKFAFTGGLNLAIAGNEVDIYSKNTLINLNNLIPLNGNLISLKNQVFYAGPSVSAYIWKHKKSAIRLNLAYELALTNGKWKSDYATVLNTAKENGNNRLVFGISLL